MNNSADDIQSFFDHYEAIFNHSLQGEPDVDMITSCFATCFVEASPKGIICGENDENFKKAIPNGYAFYRNIGVTAMKIISKEVSSLDSLHTMVKIRWKMLYKKQEDVSGAIEFDVIYFLQKMNNAFTIFSYITGDEELALKQHNLI